MTAYIVDGQDNDSYAFRERSVLTEYQKIHQELIPDMSGAARAGVRRCEACGELLAKWEESLEGLVIEKKNYDISATYDGVDVVSEVFKTAYEENGLSGLTFRPLPDSPSFYAIQATRVVEFDAERRGTRFENQCSSCGRYESVVGATPAYLKQGSHVGENEFVRTDLEFGGDDEKSPLLLCGATAATVLKRQSLKGLELLKVESCTIGS